MNDLGNLLQMIYDLLTGWFNSFTSHATDVMEKLNLIEIDTASIKNSASDIKDNTDDIKDNTGAIVTPVQSIKTNTDSIKNDTTSIKNNVSTMTNQLGTISTNVGTASAFAEDVANNTLDIKDRIVTIGSDTTQLRSNSNTITSDVSDIKTALNYYLANTPVTEDVEDNICNFDTDLTDYLQACNVTIPADLSGYSGITITKCGKNLFDLTKYQNLRTNYEYIEASYYCRAIPLKPNTTYTISQNAGITDSAVILMNRTANVNGPGYFDLRKASDVKTYTTDSTGNLYIGIVSTGTDAQANARIPVCNVQIEESDTATAYDPYKSMTYPVSFGTTITDGAEINLLDGIIKINSTPVSYLSISPVAVRTYKGINNIYSDIGTTALTYRETLKHYLDKQEA